MSGAYRPFVRARRDRGKGKSVSGRGATVHVLVVDDNPDTNEALADALDGELDIVSVVEPIPPSHPFHRMRSFQSL